MSKKTVSHCVYSVWSRRADKLRPCGGKAEREIDVTVSLHGRHHGRVRAPLCADHAAFVEDATIGPFTTQRGPHPADFDWLAKARRAYGIRKVWFAETGLPLGLPSDAGKPPHVFYTPAQRACVMARIPSSPPGISLEKLTRRERSSFLGRF